MKSFSLVLSCFCFLLLLNAPSVEGSPMPKNVVVAVIKDPDGYTNIRAAATTDSKVVASVVDGEVFWTLPAKAEWWRVWKNNGQSGFMHSSRIRTVKVKR